LDSTGFGKKNREKIHRLPLPASPIGSQENQLLDCHQAEPVIPESTPDILQPFLLVGWVQTGSATVEVDIPDSLSKELFPLLRIFPVAFQSFMEAPFAGSGFPPWFGLHKMRTVTGTGVIIFPQTVSCTAGMAYGESLPFLVHSPVMGAGF
jgi:hypothetical protein